jgi:hypothetical protein
MSTSAICLISNAMEDQMSQTTSDVKGKKRVQVKVTDAETGAELSSHEVLTTGAVLPGFCCSSSCTTWPPVERNI